MGRLVEENGGMTMKKRRITALLLVFVLCFSAVPATGFGTDAQIDVEWGNFRNSQENNGVTDRETPAVTEETTLKWAALMAEGYTESCTPPLILDGCVYTAQGRYVYKLNKETGEKELQSSKLDGQLGYAMNPVLYGGGMIFVPINNGRIQALDARTLKSLWVSEAVGGQTLSPLTYKNGYVYTGTWNADDQDGTYFCLSAKDEEPDRSDEVKKCTWKFTPSEKGETPRGFYWAGAYAADNYIAFGSDDGFLEGTDKKTAGFYTVNPATGEIIDRLADLNGDVRTTAVYSGGYLYFATKGGSLYKVQVDENGKMGDFSSVELSGMMTASPVVYNGRIYIGMCGSGDQFSTDGGHKFAVINDDAELSKSSLAYEVPVKGYPQAAALLSTAAKAQSGKVYLYFTHNAKPGGIYYLTDEPGQTSGKAETLFTPPAEMQEHCISTLCCDKDGTLYYKNDSGYLMAVAKNRAYLNNVAARADTGELRWSIDFNPGYTEYDLIAEAGTKQVTLKLDMPPGVSAEIDGKACTGDYLCSLDADGKKQITICVTKQDGDKTDTRIYTLNIRKKGSSPLLSELQVSTGNAFGAQVLPLDKTFDPQFDTYRVSMEGRQISYVNVWPQALETEADIQIYPVENVKRKGWNSDGTIDITASSAGRNRYAIYLEDGKDTARVKVRVTSEDGAQSKEYFLTIERGYNLPSLSLSKNAVRLYTKGQGKTLQLQATVSGSANIGKPVSWESTNERIVQVKDGLVTGITQGSAVIRATAGDMQAECKVTVTGPTLALEKSKVTLYTCKKYNRISLKPVINGFKNQKASWKVIKGGKVASVSASGIVTARKAGKAVVRVTANGVSKNCTVTVKKAGFKLTKASLTVKKKKTAAIKVRAVVPKGKVTYKSASKKIASVTAKGVVKGRKKGSTYIRVSCNGITKKVKVTVK